jgi:signal transduction histidine kinase
MSDLTVQDHSARLSVPAGRRSTALRGWRSSIRWLTIVLPALVVFGAEVVRHEVLHNLMPEMVGNIVTGVSALGISALILVPIYRRLEDVDARLRATEIEQAVAQERDRLARELHDGVAQALFFLNVKAEALERALESPDGAGPAQQVAAEIAQAVEDTSRRVRDAIFDLRTGPEPGESFAAWMQSYVQRFGEVQSIATHLEHAGTPRGFPLGRELHAMAIVREALHNVAKHAGAQSARVRLEWGSRDLRVTIADDGRGLPDPLPGPLQGRYGLATMAEHARAAAGSVSVSPAAGGGTSVVFTMPYAHRAA